MDGSIFPQLNQSAEWQVQTDRASESTITAQLALSESVLKEAWAVRHAAYAAQGLIDPAETESLGDDRDFFPSTKVIVIYKNGKPVATSRVCLFAPNSGILGADSVPAMDVFKEEIWRLYESMPANADYPVAVEVARLARHPSLGNDDSPVFGMYRMVCYLLLHYAADGLISAVQTHHVPFYRRLGFEKFAGPRPYAKLKVEGALMACIRKPDAHLKESLRILGLVSKSDSNFQGFIAGQNVPVFGTGRAPPELSGIFGGRLEGIQTSRSATSLRTARSPDGSRVSLAA